jgi:hypothetical protein
MNGNEHKACYGALFPSTLNTASDKKQEGKVFSYTLLSAGGLYRAGRKTEVNQDAWNECVQCPEFAQCYKLSMAKLALEEAVATR